MGVINVSYCVLCGFSCLYGSNKNMVAVEAEITAQAHDEDKSENLKKTLVCRRCVTPLSDFMSSVAAAVKPTATQVEIKFAYVLKEINAESHEAVPVFAPTLTSLEALPDFDNETREAIDAQEEEDDRELDAHYDRCAWEKDFRAISVALTGLGDDGPGLTKIADTAADIADGMARVRGGRALAEELATKKAPPP